MIKSDDDDTILVPNNLAFTSTFVNHSMQGSSKLTVKFELPLSASGSFTILEQELKQALEAYASDIFISSFLLKVVALERKYVRYKINILLQDHAKSKMKEIESKLLLTVLNHKTTLA